MSNDAIKDDNHGNRDNDDNDDARRRDASGSLSPRPDAVKEISPAAQRALNEAAQRRQLAAEAQAAAGAADGDSGTNAAPKEVGGRKGPDPIRYGDWEKDGIASDF